MKELEAPKNGSFPGIELKALDSTSTVESSDSARENTVYPNTVNDIQRSLGNIATFRFINRKEFSPPESSLEHDQDFYDQDAGRFAGPTMAPDTTRPRISNDHPMIQRSPADETTPAQGLPPQTASPAAVPVIGGIAESHAPTAGLIVEDSTTELNSGQMRKSEFLSQLRTEVCSTAESALSGTIWSAMGCPWIDHWFGYYSNRDCVSIERAIRRYAPGTAGVTTVSDYIPLISNRVRSSIATWTQTGEITGMPEGLSTALPEAGAAGAFSRIASGVGGIVSRIDAIFFKGQGGGAKTNADPQDIQSQLDSGKPLDSGVRSSVESAFGHDLSHVRVHTDSGAARLSDGLSARAFTVGNDIAFGQGEYRPGTLIGDALIAHELAHVVQQGGGTVSAAPMEKGETRYGSLEEDADMAAVGAVASMWSGVKGGIRDIASNAIPRLRSGLRLQRCQDCGGDVAPSPPTFSRGDILGVKSGNNEGWIRGRLGPTGEGQIESFPDYLKVEYSERKPDNRDYFNILEGPYRGQSGNLQAGYLDSSLTWGSSVSLVYNEDRSRSTTYHSEGTLNYGAGTEEAKIYVDPDTSKISADTDYNVQLPDAPHAGGSRYGDYAKTWFRIEGGPQGDEYLHRGDRSAGCVSVARNWPTIYNHLINKRSGNRHIGTIRRVIS